MKKFKNFYAQLLEQFQLAFRVKHCREKEFLSSKISFSHLPPFCTTDNIRNTPKKLHLQLRLVMHNLKHMMLLEDFFLLDTKKMKIIISHLIMLF